MTALQRQKAITARSCVDSVICYTGEGRKKAFELCTELRRQGLIVELDLSSEGIAAVKSYAGSKQIGGVITMERTGGTKFILEFSA